MRDPSPENIRGEKWVGHTVEHRIDWGYLSLGVAGIAVVLLIVWLVRRREDDEETDGGPSFN